MRYGISNISTTNTIQFGDPNTSGSDIANCLRDNTLFRCIHYKCYDLWEKIVRSCVCTRDEIIDADGFSSLLVGVTSARARAQRRLLVAKLEPDTHRCAILELVERYLSRHRQPWLSWLPVNGMTTLPSVTVVGGANTDSSLLQCVTFPSAPVNWNGEIDTGLKIKVFEFCNERLQTKIDTIQSLSLLFEIKNCKWEINTNLFCLV